MRGEPSNHGVPFYREKREYALIREGTPAFATEAGVG
jgi:hypothetical protein